MYVMTTWPNQIIVLEVSTNVLCHSAKKDDDFDIGQKGPWHKQHDICVFRVCVALKHTNL